MAIWRYLDAPFTLAIWNVTNSIYIRFLSRDIKLYFI